MTEMHSNAMRIYLLIAIMLLVGCANEQQNQPSYYDQIMDRPLPITQEDKDRECSFLRNEIANQQNKASVAMTMATSPLMAMAFQSRARNNIAALNSRASEVKCNAAFSSQTIVEKPQSGYSQECFNACKQDTARTNEQCFDACNK